MKKLLLSLCLTIATCNVWAAKAYKLPLTFVQPDGTELTFLIHGDEHANWYTTTDGVLILQSGDSFYIANIDESGNVSATSQLAHNAALRTSEEKALAASQNTDLFFSAVKTTQRKAATRSESLGSEHAYFPHTGTPKAVVILAQYNDVKFTLKNPKDSFEVYFNSKEKKDSCGAKYGASYGSVSQYFSDMTGGKFSPEFTIFGPVTLPYNMAYYGGSNNDNSNDEETGKMVIDAVNEADNQIDFSQFTNGDKIVDLVYVVYAGYGQNSGGAANTTWAKTSTVSGTVDGVNLSWYSVAPELNFNDEVWKKRGYGPFINGIGVTCHEFSHTMGLTDIYPTTPDAYADNQEMEYWDLMDGGEYVNNGYRPIAYTAWEREVMGWSSIEPISKNATGMEIKSVIDGGKAYKILNSADKNEYFVLENMQKTGWNTSVPGHGLLVYHVKYPYTTVNINDYPNNTKGKPGMAVVPADGAVLSSYLDYTDAEYYYSHKGDPFPGTSNVYALNDTLNLPNFKWYTGTTTVNQALRNIKEDTTTGIVTFDFISDFAAGIDNTIADSSTEVGDNNIYSIDGKYVGKDKTALPKGIYLMNKKKFIVK